MRAIICILGFSKKEVKYLSCKSALLVKKSSKGNFQELFSGSLLCGKGESGSWQFLIFVIQWHFKAVVMGGKLISARINEETAWELDFLKGALGNKKVTEVLVTAIHLLYRTQSQKKQNKTPFDFLKETGFIGGTEGRKDDSMNYKKEITERIKKKI